MACILLQAVMETQREKLKVAARRLRLVKDTGVFDDGVSRRLVKYHLVEDVDNLTHKLVVLLLSCTQHKWQISSDTIVLQCDGRCECVLPFSSSISAVMMPDLANMAAQA